MWKDDSGRDYHNGFLILEPNERVLKQETWRERGVGGDGADGLFAETSAATGGFCILSASCRELASKC